MLLYLRGKRDETPLRTRGDSLKIPREPERRKGSNAEDQGDQKTRRDLKGSFTGEEKQVPRIVWGGAYQKIVRSGTGLKETRNRGKSQWR